MTTIIIVTLVCLLIASILTLVVINGTWRRTIYDPDSVLILLILAIIFLLAAIGLNTELLVHILNNGNCVDTTSAATFPKQ